MTSIKFTATIVRKDKGYYIARADELLIKGDVATTQRGAIRKLKDAVLRRLRQAADDGSLTDFLDEAGYAGILSRVPDITLEFHNYDSQDISLPLPAKRATKKDVVV